MFDEELSEILTRAEEFAKKEQSECCTLEHFLFILLTHEKIQNVLLQDYKLDSLLLTKELLAYINEYVPKTTLQSGGMINHSLALIRVLDRLEEYAFNSTKYHVGVSEAMIFLMNEKDTFATTLLQSHGIRRLELLVALHKVRFTNDIQEMPEELKETSLDKFAINLTALAKNAQLDPLIGREEECTRILEILSRRKKNNPLLIGESGVGKSAIIEGLAMQIAQDKVPERLKDAQIYTLDVGSLLGGTKYRGDFEKRLKKILSDLKEEKNAILFIDEIHTILGAGSSSESNIDMANLLKPALANGELSCIGSTTYKEFHSHIEKDKALLRRFSKVDIKEPSLALSEKILHGIKSKYEDFHQIKYSNEAISMSIKLAKRYMSDKFLPDSAIDIIDEVGASLGIEGKNKLIQTSDIKKIVSKLTNISMLDLSYSQTSNIKHLEANLKNQIFFQDEAINAVVKALKRNYANLGMPNSPIGSFLFTGPTGVGKTQLAKCIAEELKVHFERFDMSEYQEKHSISRLVGAPPGYVGFEEGGLLIKAVKKHPFCVILLDEIEKAHEDLVNILLQIFDDATLTQSDGEKIDFQNTIIILTSNLGTKEANVLGFEKDNSMQSYKAVKNFFSPEFLARLDGVVDFKALRKEAFIKIASKMIGWLENQLKDKNIHVKISKKALEYLALHSFNTKLGARSMIRIIDEEIKTKLSDEILFGRLISGGEVKIDCVDEKLELFFHEKTPI